MLFLSGFGSMSRPDVIFAPGKCASKSMLRSSVSVLVIGHLSEVAVVPPWLPYPLLIVGSGILCTDSQNFL